MSQILPQARLLAETRLASEPRGRLPRNNLLQPKARFEEYGNGSNYVNQNKWNQYTITSGNINTYHQVQIGDGGHANVWSIDSNAVPGRRHVACRNNTRVKNICASPALRLPVPNCCACTYVLSMGAVFCDLRKKICVNSFSEMEDGEHAGVWV